MDIFRPDDLYELKEITELAISPDGSRVVYVEKQIDRGQDRSFSNLWLVSTEGSVEPRRLTRGLWNDCCPMWSSDGNQFAFLSDRADEVEIYRQKRDLKQDKGKPKFQIWILDVQQGGEARQVTSCSEGVEYDEESECYHWSPDNKRLVFVSRDPTEQQKEYLKSKDPIVVTRLRHKYDGKGYLDDVRTHLFIVDVNSRAVTRLTGDDYDDHSPRWSPDGHSIAFISNRSKNPDDTSYQDLWSVTTGGENLRQLTKGDAKIEHPRWSPDGKYIACVRSPGEQNSYALRRIMVLDTEENRHWIPTSGLDNTVDYYSYPLWSPDSRWLYAVIASGAQGRPVRMPACSEGKTEIILQSQGADSQLELFDLSADGSTAAFTLASPRRTRDVYSLPTDALLSPGAVPTRLTQVNENLLTGKALNTTSRITVTGAEGDPVEVLVDFPPDFDDYPRPAVLWIHGGPMSYDAPAFDEEVAVFTGQGYVVIRANYHGSTSYGEKFCSSIRGEWGIREETDLMAAVDEVINRGWADPQRVYIGGGSYGSCLTNRMMGRTDRFRAAVSERGDADYFSAFGTDDITLLDSIEMGLPWEAPENYWRISPIRMVKNMNTPVLFIDGAEDWRCPLSNTEQLYVSLKKRGVEAQLVIYPGESHSFSKPGHRVDRLKRILQWLEQH